jgi:acyl-CoA dehydrogenase
MNDVFEQFIEQLHDDVRERRIPSKRKIIEMDEIPADIVQEFRGMMLFSLTIPEEYGGSTLNISQYARTVMLGEFPSGTMD